MSEGISCLYLRQVAVPRTTRSSPYPCPKEPAALPLKPRSSPAPSRAGGETRRRARRRLGDQVAAASVPEGTSRPASMCRWVPTESRRTRRVECSRPRVYAAVRVGRGLSASLRRRGRAPLLSVHPRLGGEHGGECGGDSEDAAQRGPKGQAALPLCRRGAAEDGPRSSLCAGDSAESTAERLG